MSTPSPLGHTVTGARGPRHGLAAAVPRPLLMCVRVLAALVVGGIGAWVGTGAVILLLFARTTSGSALEQVAWFALADAALGIAVLSWFVLVPGWWKLAAVPYIAAGVYASTWVVGLHY